MNIAEVGDFSLDKLRAQLKRLYVTEGTFFSHSGSTLSDCDRGMNGEEHRAFWPYTAPRGS
jgi:hypothetical protein